MTVIVQERIPREKYQQFHAILCATGGRYLSNPLMSSSAVLVHYECTDYEGHFAAWRLSTTPVRETRRDQLWRRLLRRLGLRRI